MKYSKQREMVLQAVRAHAVHPTAEYIYSQVKQQLPTISLATVYRNLSLLADNGAILRLRLGDGVERYDGTTVPHHHLLCTCCRQVIDIPADVHVTPDLEDAQRQGYVVTGYEVAFRGLCPKCAAKQRHEQDTPA